MILVTSPRNTVAKEKAVKEAEAATRELKARRSNGGFVGS